MSFFSVLITYRSFLTDKPSVLIDLTGDESACLIADAVIVTNMTARIMESFIVIPSGQLLGLIDSEPAPSAGR